MLLYVIFVMPGVFSWTQLQLHLVGKKTENMFMFPHHSDQMSQRWKVSKIALWRCSLNVFVIVFVFVFVFVFLLVMSCFLMIPINFARLGFGLEGWNALNPTQSVSESVTKVGLELLGQLKKTSKFIWLICGWMGWVVFQTFVLEPMKL